MEDQSTKKGECPICFGTGRVCDNQQDCRVCRGAGSITGSTKVITNNVPRDVIEAHELTADERAEFDYIDWPAVDEGRESASFIRYRGELYDLGEFEVWDNPVSPTRQGWDGYRSDSYFSGLVVRYVDNFERVVVGLYLN